MPLSDIVDVTITTQTKGIAQAGFGTPIIVGYHDAFLELVREYSDLASLVTDGITVNHPIYKAAQAIMGQSPHPSTFKVGRRALAFTETIELKPTDITEDLVYTVKVVSLDGTETTCSYTVLNGDAVADIVTALAALITAITDLTATDATTHVSCAADNAGEYFFYEELNAALEFTDVTTDPGIATDLAAIYLYDPDWYAACIDSNSETEIKAAAAYIETLDRIAAFNTKDAGVKDSGVSDDIATDLQGLAYVRNPLIYSEHHQGYAGAAWLGEMLTTTPGSATWAFKTLAGVSVDSLNTTEQATVEGKSCNHYLRIAGVNITRYGITPGDEYIDIIRGRDWLKARLQERVYAILVNNPKVPYTDGGVDLVRTEVRAQLREGISNGYLAADPPFTVTAPLVADVSANDKANRLLPDIDFEATLAGAIHKVVISGVLSI